MGTTIASLAVRILADTEGVTKGLGITAREARLVKEGFTAARSETEKLQIALDKLASLKEIGAFKGDQDYAAAVAQVKNELDPATRASNALAASVEQVTQRLRDEALTAGMSAEALELHRLRAAGATDATLTQVSALQAEAAAARESAAAAAAIRGKAAAAVDRQRDPTERFNAEMAAAEKAGLKEHELAAFRQDLAKRVLPAAESGERDLDAARQEAAAILDGLNPREAEYRRGMEQARRLRQQQLLTDEQFIARQKQLREARDAEHAAAGKALRTRVQSPFAKASEQAGEINTLRRGGQISGWEALLGHSRNTGEMLQATNIPGISSLGGAFANLHPAILGVNAALGIFKITAAAATAAAMGLAYALYRQLEAVQQLSMQAKELGVSVRQMAAIDMAARRAGISGEALAGALGKLNAKVGEARSGNAEAASAFARLGINLRTLSTMSAGERLEVITARLQSIGNASDRAALAQKLLGEEARRLAPLLADGSVSMKDWDEAARKSRLGITEADDKSVNDMDAAWTKVADDLHGIFRQVSVQLSPALKAMAEDLSALFESPAGDQAIVYLMDALKVGATEAAVATDAIKNSLLAFWDIASGAEIAVRGLYVAYLKLQEVRTGDKEYTKAIAEQKANISALSAEIASHWTAAGMMAATNYVGGLQDQMKKKPPPAPKPPKAQGADEDWSAKMTEDVQKLTEAIAKDIVTMGMSADELARWELAQAGIPAVVIENVKAFQEQRAAMRWEDNADKTVRELTDAIAEDIVTMGMSTDEIQRWRAAQKGATEAQLDNLKVFQRQRAEQSFDKKLDEDVRKLTESLAEQIVTAGMSAEQLTAWKIAQQGADEATVENIRTLAEQAESAKFAAQTKEDILTPAEIYQRQMDKLWKAVELGQLTIEQFNKAKKKLEDPIIAKIEMQGVSAAIEGSREAAEAILRHRKKLADANATILPFGQSDQAEKGAAAIGAGVKWAQAAAAGVAGTVSGWFQGNGVAAEQPSGEQQVQVAATLPDSVVDLWSKALAALERIAQQTDREPVELTEVDSLGG